MIYLRRPRGTSSQSPTRAETMQTAIMGLLLLLSFAVSLFPCQQTSSSDSSGGTGGAGLSSGFTNWRPENADSAVAAAAQNATKEGAGTTYYWGSHQVGETVLAFSRDQFSQPHPVPVQRRLTFNKPGAKISYLEVFVRNASPQDLVYVAQGGIGTHFITVVIGSQSPTPYFEYKATLYGFE